MLVSQNIVSAWYKRDSLVYKNFAFFFQNPLWNKKVPNGCSVCPFWWISVFTFFILRPFVYSVLGPKIIFLGVGGLIRAAKFERIFQFTDGFILNLFGSENKTLKNALGTATISAISVLLMAGAIFYSASLIAIAYYQAQILTACILPVINCITFGGCLIYIQSYDECKNRCKVEIYMRVLIVASVLIAFFFHPDYAKIYFYEKPIGIIVGVWGRLGHIFHVIFHAAGHAFFMVFHWCAGILSGLKYALMNTAIVLAILGIYGFIMMKSMDRAGEIKDAKSPIPEEKLSKANDKDFRERLWYVLYRDGGGFGLDFWHSVQCWDIVKTIRNPKKFILEDNSIDWPNYVNYVKEYQAKSLEKAKADKAKRAIWDAKCKKTTEFLNRLFAPLHVVGRFFGKVLKHIWIFLNIVWQVIWAYKKGACPYMTFADK